MPENPFIRAPHESDRQKQEIGGIPLPPEHSEKTISRRKLAIYNHRGFGNKTISETRIGEGLVGVENMREGLEKGIEAGADTLEIDFAKTADGRLVTAHLAPLQKLSETQDEYLANNPDAMTGGELMDWLYHQDPAVKLYVEMKSADISLEDIIDQIRTGVTSVIEKDDSITDKTAAIVEGVRNMMQRVEIYGGNKELIQQMLQNKVRNGLTTDQLKLWMVYDVKPIDEQLIDQVASLGVDNCRIAGLEQGGMPWGTSLGLSIQERIGKFLSNKGIAPDFKDIKRIVDYAHSKGLKFITGTVDDPEWIRKLIDQGVDGIVPNNAVDFEMAGITRPAAEKPLEVAKDAQGRNYVPESMRQRLQNYEEQRITTVRTELHTNN